jgi:excisionase family DNA binding protein
MADDDLLTVADVAAQFRVTAQTVRSWIDSGKLRAARVGKSYVILRRDVQAMLEQAASERRSSRPEVWAERDPSLGLTETWASTGRVAALKPPRSR